jgi:hypothetical protein
MKKSEMINMTIRKGQKVVELLNACCPYREWSLGDDVFCRWCEGYFKVVDMVINSDGHAACPMCGFDNPDEFHTIPSWRRDLMVESWVSEGLVVHTWRVPPIRAVLGKPQRLPRAAGDLQKKEQQ